MNNATIFCSVCERTYPHREVLRDGLFDDVAAEKRAKTRDRMAALLLEHSVCLLYTSPSPRDRG